MSVVGRSAALLTLLGFTLLGREQGLFWDVDQEFTGGRVLLLLAFVVMSGHLAGSIAKDMGLPRITGFLLLGVVIGPGVLGVLTEADVASLRFLDAAAISLIALSAGGELKLSELRSRGRSIFGIMSAEMLAVGLVMTGMVVIFAGYLPFTQGRAYPEVLIIALVFASVAIANSPAVTVAVVNDQQARGPVTSTVLGVTVLKDVAIIVFFAALLSLGRSVLGDGQGLSLILAKTLWWEVAGSIAMGAILGWGISQYLRRVGSNLVLFVFAVALVGAAMADVLRLEVLLLSLTAGFFVENISPDRGEPFIEAVEANAVPVYALFFTLAGAGIHLDILVDLWPMILGLAVVRAAAIYVGTRVGASLTDAPAEVRRYAWTGFISQAGVALGMVTLAAQAFPEWGPQLSTLFVALVAVHELAGPVLLQWGLRAAGETGRRETAPEILAASVLHREGGAGKLRDSGHGGVANPALNGDGVEALGETG